VFDPIVPRLARARRLTRLNLPGFGDSTPAGPRIEDYADRVATLLTTLPLSGAPDVLGMSFGGFVATALAAPLCPLPADREADRAARRRRALPRHLHAGVR
jgi:pimeloyl-ACP methyl ester carboxylesterase